MSTHPSFFKVRYEGEPPTVNLKDCIEIKKKNGDLAFVKYLLNNSFAVKFRQWSYEQEYRLISNKFSMEKDGFISLGGHLPFLKIVGVIMGMHSPVKNIIENLCRQFQIDLYEACCSEEAYKITMKKMGHHTNEIELLKPVCECKCLSQVS